MWKPGAPKPSLTNEDVSKKPTRVSTPTHSTDNATRTNGTSSGSSNRKKLSGATLGMRFMQRGNPKMPELLFKKQTPQKDDEKMELDEDVSSSLGDGDDASHVSEAATATPSDMYGIKVDLVGRRSFGGFEKIVNETWNSSLSAYTDGKAGQRAKKEQISDEELLRRYEQYIKNRGGDIDIAAAAPVGNLDGKLKKKQARESRHRGEKRKRP